MTDPAIASASPADSTLGELRHHACALCQSRKVKCDRKDPCSNCVKAQAGCEYRVPLPPRRRRKMQKPNTMAMARLKRYEDAFRKVGINPDAVDARSPDPLPRICDDEFATRGRAQPADHGPAAGPPFHSNTNRDDAGKLVTKDGRSIYLHSDLWKSISNELQDDIFPESSADASEQLLKEQSEEADLDEHNLIFGTASKCRLTDLHPNPVHVFKLWQVFLDNVNPLTKIIHAPTLQQRILSACGDLGSVSKELEALMFAIYCAALTSLDDAGVVKELGETRTKLLPRYRQGAQRALINAGFLKTFDMTVLQALVIFIVSVRLVYDPHALWSLSGIAVRIAQRIGLHRDGSRLGLSVFETEMRRRLWWQVITVDAIIGQMSGFASPIAPHSDTRGPLNVNDSDLDPDMRESPVEAAGATEMVFCLTRYEFGQWLLRQANSKFATFDSYWETISTASISPQEKDRSIEELEDILKEKYIRHCDPSIPLHLITLIVARSMVPMIRLSAHHPRIYQERGESPSQSEKDRLFAGCVTVAEHSNTFLTTNKTRRYSFHVDYHFPWASFIYMLSELRHRTVGDETANAWQLIDVACTSQYRKLGRREKSPLHLAVANLGIKAWAAHVAECDRRRVPPLPLPNIVTIFWELIQRAKPTVSSSHPSPATDTQMASHSFGSTTEGTTHGNCARRPGEPSLLPDVTGHGRGPDSQRADTLSESIIPIGPSPGDFSALPEVNGPEDSPMDWVQWDELLQQFHQQHHNTGAFSGL